MRRDQLEHLIRAAGAILGTDKVIVIGSQAILASCDENDLPPEATQSIEADLLPLDDPDGRKADLIDGALGEASLFQDAFGVYGQGVGLDTARLPRDWQRRLAPISNANTHSITGWCLDRHDLAISKLLANRDKDRRFCSALLAAGLLDTNTILVRLNVSDASDSEKQQVKAFLASCAAQTNRNKSDSAS